jgi:hypothetical protein
VAVASPLTRYRPLRKIASGGMATISLAEDTVLGRPVALKRLRGTASQAGMLRLRREALVGASVSHPNLVSIYDVVTDDDDVVIVMEYVEGRTLKDALVQDGRLSPADALRILRGVASALDAIHARGIVHRDVKPPNVLLGRDGGVKLADLGIAAAPDHTSITTEGSVLGSFSYMAPEQLEAAPPAPAMDVYALAAVAFEALSGRRARQEDNPLALAHAIATQPPPDLRTAWPDAPREVSDLLKRGMSRSPAERPRSAGELIDGLESALAPGSAGAVGAAAAAGAAAAGGAGIAAAAAEAAPRDRPARPAGPGGAVRAARPARAPGGARAAGAAAAGAAAGAGAAAAAARTGAAGAAGPRRTGSPEPRTDATARVAAPIAAPTRGTAGWNGAPGETTHRRRPAWLVPLLLGLVLAAILAVVLGSGGGPSRTAATGTRQKSSATKRKPAARTDTNPASTTTSTPATASTGPGGNQTPISAVERFYELAAAHQFAAAWALADPAFRSQLEGYDSFVAGQEGDRRIIFDSARVTSQTSSSAIVAISTTSIRYDGTQRCAGTVDVVPGGGGWLLHQIDINCQPALTGSPSPAPGRPAHPGHGKPHPAGPGKKGG